MLMPYANAYYQSTKNVRDMQTTLYYYLIIKGISNEN